MADDNKNDDATLNRNVETGNIPVQDDSAKDDKSSKPADREVPAGAQTAPTEVDQDSGKVVEGDVTDQGDLHVVQHLDKDPNDPRNAAPTPVLPSLDADASQGPAHGRISQEDDHSEAGQNGPNV